MPINAVQKCAAGLTGGLLVSLGINLFLIPHRLIDGGMTGIGLLLQYFYGWYPGQTIFFLSVPIYIVVFFLNRPLFFWSLFGLFLTSVWIDLLSPLRTVLQLPAPMHAMYGGTLIGSGVGLMLAYGMNTGGTDMIAQMIAMRYHIPPALTIFLIDFVILLFGLHALGTERTLFSLVAVVFVALFTHYFAR